MRSCSKAWRVLTVLGLAAVAMAPLTAAQAAPQSMNGEYRFENQASGKCLDVKDASLEDEAPIIQYTCNGGNNQQFTVLQEANGYYSLETFARQFVAVKDTSSTPDGTPIIQIPSQDATEAQMTFDLRWTEKPDVYLIALSSADKCLDVTDASQADGTPIILYTCNQSASNQQFKMVRRS